MVSRSKNTTELVSKKVAMSNKSSYRLEKKYSLKRDKNESERYIDLANNIHWILAQQQLDERAWFDEFEQKYSHSLEADSIQADAYIIMHASSFLVGASLNNAIRRTLLLASEHGYRDSRLDIKYPGQAEIIYRTEQETLGISYRDILQEGQSLVMNDPVGLYGYMLLSTSVPQNEDDLLESRHAFMPITMYTPDTLRIIGESEGFPEVTMATLLDLSQFYRKSQSKVSRNFFNPNSRHFPKILELYEQLSQAPPYQMEIFLSQILGIDDNAQIKASYKRLKELITKGREVDLYSAFLQEVENRYEGPLGEDLYDTLDIEKSLDGSIDRHALAGLDTTKQRFLRTIKNSQHTQVPAGIYGLFDVESGSISYDRLSPQNLIHVSLNVERLDGASLPIELTLNGKVASDWNFLRSFEEVPELFNATVVAVDEAIRRIIENTYDLAEEPISSKQKKEHVRDDIYELRKLHKEEHHSLELEEFRAEEQETDPITGIPREVVFPEEVRNRLSPEVLEGAERAINKYQSGLQEPRRFSSLWEKGRKVFRLKSGNVRVLIESDNGVSVVIAAGLRSTIYK